MKNPTTLSSNSQGSVMVVAILIATTFSGLFLGWQYLQNMRMGGQGLKETAVLSRIANSVATRITQLLPLTIDPTGNCTPGFLATNFEPFRDFTNPAPVLILTQTSPGVQGCLLKTAAPNVEFGTGSPLATLQITLQQIGQPDPVGLFTTIGVSVIASSSIAAGGHAAHSVTVNSKISLWVQSLASYNLVLTGGPTGFSSAHPQVGVASPRTDGLSNLEVKGSTFYADNIPGDYPLDLASVVQTNPGAAPPAVVSPVTFDGPFDLQGPSFSYANAAATPGCPSGTNCPTDLSLMAKSFRGGLNVNVMWQAVKLPIADNGGTTGGAFTWNEPLDYKQGVGKFPIPDLAAELPGSAMWGTQVSPGVPGAPAGATSYSAADMNYVGISPNLTQASIGGGSVVPDPPGSTGIATLDQTCTPETPLGTPPPNEFVFLQQNSNLGIDFTGTVAGGSPGPVFCGLIAAKNLYVYAPAGGGPYYVFGLIVAHSVSILGGGQVVFANPLENAAINPNPFTGSNAAGQTQAGIAADFNWLATSYGHNFFVPAFQVDPATLTGMMDTYRPHGSLRKTSCCAAPSSGMPLNIDDTVGFACTCANDSGGACPQAPVPGGDNNYCIATPGAPSGAQNAANLFSATNLPKLLFMTKVVQ